MQAAPTVLVPVLNAVAELDGCLASLECVLPKGAAVLIVDDASGDAQVEPLARGWCGRSRLQARYLRNETSLGLAASCNRAISSLATDVLLLRADASATPGVFEQLARCAANAADAATIVPWSNRGELCSFPQLGDANPLPEFPEAIAEAAASIAWADRPELPASAGPCLFLRRAAFSRLGGLDAETFHGARALDDFCRRAAAMGWRNLLCPSAYVGCSGSVESLLSGGDDLGALVTRWPDYQEQVARFLLADPLRAMRERLQARIDELSRSGPQRDLFN